MWEEAFCGVRGWVKELPFFFRMYRRISKKVHIYPTNSDPEMRAIFGEGFGAFPGPRNALIQPPPSTLVVTPGSPPRKHAQAAWRGAKSKHCVDTECAFHSTVSILCPQNAWRVQGRPQATPGTVCAWARETFERQAASYNVDQNPIFRYFENIIRYSFKAVSDYGFDPERSLLKYRFLQICSYLGPPVVSIHDF